MNEMRDQAPKKTLSVILTSIGTAALIYLSVAITGYLSFGDNITSNIVGMCTFEHSEINLYYTDLM